MPKTEILTDLPDSELAQVVEDFESEGATVSKTKQPDGLWTVTATFPDDEAAAAKAKAPAKKSAPAKKKAKQKK